MEMFGFQIHFPPPSPEIKINKKPGKIEGRAIIMDQCPAMFIERKSPIEGTEILPLI